MNNNFKNANVNEISDTAEQELLEQIESSLEATLDDILMNYEYEKERKEFLERMDSEDLEDENIIKSVSEFNKAIKSAESGTILKADKKVVENSIKNPFKIESKKQEKITSEWMEIIKEVCEKYEDFLIAFYIIYINLDDDYKNELSSILEIFNYYYQTDYKNVKEVLGKNNLKSIMDLEKYVYNNLNVERKM